MRKYTLNNKDGVSEKKKLKEWIQWETTSTSLCGKKQWVVNSHSK